METPHEDTRPGRAIDNPAAPRQSLRKGKATMKIKTAALIAMVGLSLSLVWQLLYPYVYQSLLDSLTFSSSRNTVMAVIGIPASLAHTGTEILLAYALYRAAR